VRCSNCGAELADGGTHCSQCGAEIRRAPQAVPPTPAKAKPRLKLLPIVVGGVISVALIFLLGYLVGVMVTDKTTGAFVALVQITGFFSIFAGGAVAGAMAGVRGTQHGLLAGLLVIIPFIIFITSSLAISGSGFFAWRPLLALINIAITLGLSTLGGAFGRWLRDRYHLRRSTM